MKVEPVGEGSLRVWLSEGELAAWGIDPQDSDSGDWQTRQGLRRLIRRVLEETHRQPGSRMLAELIPVEEGFVLLLTQTAGGGQATPLVYRLADADALYSLAERWCALREEDAPGTCLYEREEAYDLAVYPLGLLTAARRRLLAEYGRLQGSGEAVAAYCAEHGCLLAAGDALGKLLLKESVPAAPAPEDPLH